MKKDLINVDNKVFWNIVKGIGIIFIVMGHCNSTLRRFVYLFHLPLFFFIGGYLYTKEKYIEKPWDLFVQRLKTNYKKYVIYCLIVLYLHNIFLKVGIIYNYPVFKPVDFVINTVNTFVFLYPESMVGALWFVPVYIFSSAIFSTMLYYLNKVFNNKTLKYIGLIIANILISGVGLYLAKKGCVLICNIQVAFVVVPFYSVGFIIRNNIKNLSKILSLIAFILVTISLIYVMKNHLLSVDLVNNEITNYWLFYLCGVFGIYFSLYISKIINTIVLLPKLLSDIGSYSFEIMAFHLLVFKLIDVIITIPAFMNNTAIISEYSKFPYAYAKAWPLYLLFGVLIPYLLFKLIDKIKTFAKSRFIEKHS